MIPSNVRFLVADTETTGVEDDDKVVELGWIEIDENLNVIDQHESLIDPQRVIAPEASAVHGLTIEDLQDSPTIEEYFSVDDPSCYGRPITDPVIVIGHRISFDTRFLKPYITNIVGELCTLRWFRRLYPDSGNHQLQTAIYALGLPRSEGAHRVMADVYSAFYLCQHIMERTGLSLRDLAQASLEPMEVTYMPFGKHKGEKMADVPSSYLRWMMNTMDGLDADLKFTAQQVLNNKKK